MTREDLHKRLLATFREEAIEHAHALSVDLEVLTKSSSAEIKRDLVESLFRVMHTLKGAARSVAFTDVEQICQRCESLLGGISRGETDLTPSVLRVLREATDDLQRLISSQLDSQAAPVKSGKLTAPAKAAEPDGRASSAAMEAAELLPAPPKAPGGPSEDAVEKSPGGGAGDSVRVDVQRLDRLVLAAEELLLPSLVGIERVRAARDVVETVSGLRVRMRSKYFSANGQRSGVWNRDERMAVMDSLREVENKGRRLLSALADDQRTLRHIVGDLFQETRQARMLPAAIMLAAFPLMIRDLCRETGKKVKFRTAGSEVQLDRKVIELVKDPLIHLVRNAIDHGIEPPDEREAAGKPRGGTVRVSISPIDNGRIVIEVSDDGRGLNLSSLRDAAVRSRTGSAAVIQSMSDDEVVDLAFRPGVSTSPVITAISGHGLGLAIVREQVERVDGRVAVRFTPNQGTQIILDMPMTIASYRGLLVSVGNSRLLWPAESVDHVLGIPKAEANAAHKAGFVAVDGESLPYVKLANVLGVRTRGAAANEKRGLPCVVAHNGARRAVVEVDEIHGEAEVMVKDLPSPLRRVRHIAAAGLLATGELTLVLRPSDVMAAAQSAESGFEADPEQDGDRAMHILVVDDSITTRTMERNLLEAAGYTVSVAIDGIEAWDHLQSETIDLVVSDIDMPRMNGFELTTKIRADPRLANLPVVLVTALESREDKERGVRIGANAYVLKSSFDQSGLLDIVGRLV